MRAHQEIIMQQQETCGTIGMALQARTCPEPTNPPVWLGAI